MIAAINPNAELGPTGFYIGAAIFALIALGVLISGLHPQWRATARWRGDIRRSAFGSLAFSVGLLIMGIAMVTRGVLHQHGPFAGVPLWLICCGVAVLIVGPIYDLVQSVRGR